MLFYHVCSLLTNRWFILQSHVDREVNSVQGVSTDIQALCWQPALAPSVGQFNSAALELHVDDLRRRQQELGDSAQFCTARHCRTYHYCTSDSTNQQTAHTGLGLPWPGLPWPTQHSSTICSGEQGEERGTQVMQQRKKFICKSFRSPIKIGGGFSLCDGEDCSGGGRGAGLLRDATGEESRLHVTIT